jgi:SAM-dependent methyltransferase
VCHWKPAPNITAGIDIGAGAGFLTAAFAKRGVNMTATEYHPNGIELIRRENPALPVRQLDLLQYRDAASWDLIVCRELYPFTRVNAFSDQLAIVSNLVDSLNPGGILLIIGSEATWPHCMDYRLLARVLRKDLRLQRVSAMYLEPLVRRCRRWGFGLIGYWAAYVALWPYIALMRRLRGWALHYAIVFQKNPASPAG